MIDVPVEVKDALREGSYKKNYRFVVLDDTGSEDFTIDNDNLVKESVSIDERMNSGDTVKFGLCEGSSLEFQYFDKENITGRQLQVFIDVGYEDAGTELTQNDSYTVSKAGNYEILVPANTPGFDVSYQPDGGLIETIRVYSSSVEQTVPLNNCGIGDVVSISASRDISVTLRGEGGIAFYEIPMGFFTVKNCSRQASTGIIKVTAYNKLQSEYLDAKANDLLLVNADEIDTFNDKISIYSILYNLLGDYGIHVHNQESINPSRFYVGALPSTAWRQINFGSGNVLYCTIGKITISLSTPLDEYSYYQIELFGRSFIEALTHYLFHVYSYPSGSTYGYYENAIVSGTNETGAQFIANRLVPFKLDMITSHSGGGTAYESVSVAMMSEDKTLKPYSGYDKISIWCPVAFGTYGYTEDDRIYTWFQDYFNPLIEAETVEICKVYQLTDVQPISSIELDVNNVSSLPDVTLRELQSAVYESSCQFGQLSRETDLFSGVELNHSRLLPADTLYPANSLYPNGAQESAFRSQYSKLWADEGNIHKWRYLIITYKGLNADQQEEDFTLQRTVNNDGTDDYNMSDNWLFRNLIWTADQVAEYAQAMVAKMQDITWFPFEMWCAGLPYLETGDEIEIPLGEETYTSYILQRQLKGIQNLQDTYINGTLDIF